MRMQKEEIATLTLLAFAAAGMLLFSMLTAPVPGGTFSAGNQVTVEGTLLHTDETYKGGHLLMTVKTTDRLIKVFVPSSSDGYPTAKEAEPGKTLSISGKVQDYKGELELVAESVRNL